MPRIIDNYSLNEPIGEGVYGKVYKAVHIKNKQEYAVKVVPVQRFKDNPKLEECTVNEINTLSSIETSPHIVKYIEMLKTNNNFYFVYEFCNGGTLEKLLKVEGHLSESKALTYFRQLVEAFKILYKHNIMHRDLKPDNILFHNGVLKLGDFGFCKNLKTADNMASTMLGSPIYMAP
jgi:serine/threonine protein kinase